MKLSTKLDSDELYCVAKTVAYCLSVSLFVHFFSLQWKFLSQISQVLLAQVFSNFVYVFRKAKCIV